LNQIDTIWNLFQHKNKTRTYLTKVDKNWEQKSILTLFFINNIFM